MNGSMSVTHAFAVLRGIFVSNEAKVVDDALRQVRCSYTQTSTSDSIVNEWKSIDYICFVPSNLFASITSLARSARQIFNEEGETGFVKVVSGSYTPTCAPLHTDVIMSSNWFRNDARQCVLPLARTLVMSSSVVVSFSIFHFSSSNVCVKMHVNQCEWIHLSYSEGK
jgi:hypothetical protein